MGIFGRKRITENAEEKKGEDAENRKNESTEREQGEKGVKVKKIKDLNAQNKRRRKEPVRAWRRSDRIIIFSLLVLTFAVSLYLNAVSKGFVFKKPFSIKLPIIDFSLHKTVIVNSDGYKKEISEEIVDDFIDETKNLKGKYGLFVVVLEKNQPYEFGVNEKEMFQAASLIKLPVMAGMYIGEEDNSLSSGLSTRYKLKVGDKREGSGSLYGKPAGYELSYRDMIRLMGKESDNTAFNICRKILGDDKINDITKNIGMADTSLETNETTPSDIGRFFQKLYLGELLNKDNSDELLSFLTDTKYEDWLTKGLPKNVRISHKYGRETGVVNDAGIVFSDPAYVIVVMSRDADINEADMVIPELSKTIHELLSQ